MKKAVQDLLTLQEVDMRIRDLNIRLQTIPGERAKIVAEFDTVRKAYAAAQAAVQNVEKKIRACQLENASEQENLKNSRIRSATIKKMAEFEAINTQIANSEKRISELETRELELYDELEKVKAAELKVSRSYKATGRLAQGEVRELDALKEKIIAEIKIKMTESAALEKNISQSTLSQYKRILSSGKGEPVNAIRNGVCSNCNLRLTPQTLNEATKGNILVCEHCSYFIYDPDAEQ